MEEEKNFTGWVKKHKKAIVITGVGIVTVVGAVLIGKNWTTLCELAAEIQRSKGQNKLLPSAQVLAPEIVTTVSLPEVQSTAISEVSSFIRNLPEGYHASAAKVATAAENGFELVENQKWVEPFVRRIAA